MLQIAYELAILHGNPFESIALQGGTVRTAQQEAAMNSQLDRNDGESMYKAVLPYGLRDPWSLTFLCTTPS